MLHVNWIGEYYHAWSSYIIIFKVTLFSALVMTGTLIFKTCCFKKCFIIFSRGGTSIWGVHGGVPRIRVIFSRKNSEKDMSIFHKNCGKGYNIWKKFQIGSVFLMAQMANQICNMQYPWGYAVLVRICITRESYHQYPWVIFSVSVSHILSTRESCPQYPWVTSSVPVSHIHSTREDMQYSWVISSVPVSHILSTCEDMRYPRVISLVPVIHILSTRESFPQYPWVISSVPVRICSTRESNP